MPRSKSPRTTAQIEAERARNRRWNAANKERRRAVGRLYYLANREALLARGRERYRPSPELLEKQQGRCAICQTPFGKVIHRDHDHSTGQWRGLLCQLCNQALGGFRDSPELLRRAAEYLEGYAVERSA